MESLKDAKMHQEANPNNWNSEVANENLAVSPANKLGEDILTLIFDLNSYWISKKDLLNFRLVNKNWRDAATVTLLRRDACTVVVSVKVKPTTFTLGASRSSVSPLIPHSDLIRSQSTPDLTSIRGDESFKTISRLTQLISNSPKFPASSFEIHTPLRCCPDCPLMDYAHCPDLVEFFKLHGEKIKTLRPHGWISQDLVLDICCTYASKLECLDLSEAEARMPWHIRSNRECASSKWTSKILPFKTLCLPEPEPGEDEDSASALVQFLLSSTSKLLRLTHVTDSQLDIILKEGKGDLVKCFEFNGFDVDTLELTSGPNSVSSLLDKFSKVSPKLSKLVLSLPTTYDEWDERTAAAINAIIRSSRQSLQYFRLDYFMGVRGPIINIPPMQSLKTLVVMRDIDVEFYDSEDFDEPEPVLCYPFAFEDEFPGHKYFPSLNRVKLDFVHFGSNNNIASPASHIPQFPKSSCSKVDTLEICSIYWHWESLGNVELDYTVFSEVFPNVRVLKFSCGAIRNLSGTLWKMRSLEFIEIYDISRYEISLADVGYLPLVDQFFTGFSSDMCRKLQTQRLPKEMENKVTLNFLQMKPSMRDLQNLKELKLQFADYFSGQFASHLTGEYVFSKMPDTKFIVSYDAYKIKWSEGEDMDEDRFGQNDSEENDDKIEKYEEICFGPIKRYVQIIR